VLRQVKDPDHCVERVLPLRDLEKPGFTGSSPLHPAGRREATAGVPPANPS
jgi:hypothetical protein